MDLGAIFGHIQQLPKQAQTVLLSGLKLTDAKHTPAGAVLIAMQLLTALGVPRQIDLVLGEEHTPRFQIRLSRFFVDGSLLQLDGVFAQASKVCPGRGKDSLSQLVTSLVAASGSRLPVSFDVLPGNTKKDRPSAMK